MLTPTQEYYRDPIVVMWKNRVTTEVPKLPANLMQDSVVLEQELRQFSEFVLMFTGVFEDDDFSESFDSLEACLKENPDRVYYTISGRIKEAPAGVNPWHDLHDANNLKEAEVLLEQYRTANSKIEA
ncbi:MAG: hypothetical protein CMF12_13990 [Idiomarina sp.]|uniref:hypothetical protein n=1 Tax=Idiomarina sp. TaxID=1874361 RepID=UPI000C391F9C|nr:hypothetical protein [Idiomarina sp.]MBT43617.1 hypothetical protein [Idiomarina sp.]|tara:strand:+ start:520 stop:900 length:381 start_codon:yes stop_codon:yes gene_type:complete